MFPRRSKDQKSTPVNVSTHRTQRRSVIIMIIIIIIISAPNENSQKASNWSE